MSRRFICSSADWDQRPPQPAHRRRQMHGPLQPMARPRAPDWGGRICLAIAGLTALYFTAQMLRPLLGGIFP